MTGEVVGYRIILPQHWLHLPVHGDVRDRVRAVVDDALRAAPKSLSPDELGPLRRTFEHRLLQQLEAAKQAGGRDVYLPGPDVNGLLVGATIVVSEANVPPAPEGGRETDVLALLAADGGRVVELDGTPWVRVEQTLTEVGAAAAQQPEPELPTRRVSYTGLRPGHPPRWVLVAFSCVGDGDPTSANTDAVVDLFDAVMGTWVWARATDAPAVLPTKESA